MTPFRTEPEALRSHCLELALTAPGDPLENARRFYAFITGEDAQVSISESSLESLAANERAAESGSAICATTTRASGWCSESGSTIEPVSGSDGAANEINTTPSREPIAGTSEANNGAGGEPTNGALASGIFLVSGGIVRRIHDGELALVKTASGWVLA